jgi:hypothetical protein
MRGRFEGVVPGSGRRRFGGFGRRLRRKGGNGFGIRRRVRCRIRLRRRWSCRGPWLITISSISRKEDSESRLTQSANLHLQRGHPKQIRPLPSTAHPAIASILTRHPARIDSPSSFFLRLDTSRFNGLPMRSKGSAHPKVKSPAKLERFRQPLVLHR